MASTFPIIKISATGNDFLLVDLLEADHAALWKREFGGRSRMELTRALCDRHEGLGADGLVVLEKDSQLDFAWDFYNSDGGAAEMCGNAARAVSLYYQKKTGKKKLAFRSKVGEVHAEVRSGGDVEVILPAVAESEWNQLIDGSVHFDFVRAGVPHAVVRVPSVEQNHDLHTLAAMVKKQPRFLKEGVNVTFVRLLSELKLESVTFERGVEGFTRACGTGAIAAAYSLVRGEENREVEVQVPGGRLFVLWKNGRPHLRGPAKIVAEMRMIQEA
jgi:diaminopimelate epimerase